VIITARKQRPLLAAGLSLLALPALAEFSFGSGSASLGSPTGYVRGYVREYLSMNLENQPDLNYAQTNPRRIGGKGELSMARTTLKLDMGMDFGSFQVFAVGRSDREIRTGYLEDLNSSASHSDRLTGSRFAEGFITDQYDNDELREWYTTFNVGSRVKATLGKQQVAWGETDFFQAMDIIHGYDFRWRSFLELEADELRKPLIMANFVIDVPELGGELQLLFRPGWDSKDQIGHFAPLEGGRWAPQPFRGVDLEAALPYDYNSPNGDHNDPTYGLRWSGFAKGIGYSLGYYRGFNLEPIANPDPLFGKPFGNRPKNNLAVGEYGNLIFPMIDIFGATINADLPQWKTTVRAEVGYTPNKPFNYGTQPDGVHPFLFSGMGGVVEKNLLAMMVGIDQTYGWTQKVFKTQRPSTFTYQIFDNWILDYDRKDDIVDTFGYAAPRKEHKVTFTAAGTLNYRYDTINPGLAFIYDFNGDHVVLIPSVDFVMGDHWRLRAEADIFLIKDERGPYENPLTDGTRGLGTMANSSQLAVRLTYQF
jgi:hypothetical protein